MKVTFNKLLFFLLIFPIILSAQDSLKVLSYNIEGMKPGTNPALRLGLIISELKQIDADIIGLQEINEDVNGDGTDNQGLRIKNALEDYFGTEYYYYQQQTHLSWDNQFKEFIGIISKYPVNDQGYYQLVSGVFPRKIVWNQISTPVGEINFFNTHLSFNSASVRLVQVEQADDYIITTSASNGIISNILSGDFNAIPESPVIEHLTSPSEIYYFSSFQKANPELAGFTVPSNNPNAKIDFVFYTNKSTLSVDTSYIVMDVPFSEDMYYSDHLGIISIFSYSNNTTIGEITKNSKKTFKLSSVYPNPSDGNVSLDYEVFTKTNIKISLFNQQGQKINTFVNEVKTPDKYSLRLDCSELNNNTYLLKVEAEGAVATRKLIILN